MGKKYLLPIKININNIEINIVTRQKRVRTKNELSTQDTKAEIIIIIKTSAIVFMSAPEYILFQQF